MATELGGPAYWILTALTHGPRHGYAILKDVATLSQGDTKLRVTTLYAALERLEDSGLIAGSGEETVEGRRRRYVELTPEGAEALAAEALRRARDADRARARLEESGWCVLPATPEVI